MRKISFLALLIGIMFFMACGSDSGTEDNPAPAVTADFSFVGGNCTAPCEVSFTNNSTNATTYLWDFGDGTTSFEANPTHTYTLDGDYTVELSAIAESGTKMITKTVSISAPTQARITSVTITDMPFLNGSGASWDSGSGPDVFFKLLSPNSDGNNVLVDANDNMVSDVIASDLPLSWTFNTPYLIPTNDEFYFIQLWDDDTGIYFPDDEIDFVSFRINNYMTGADRFPEEITVTQNNSTVKIGLAWE